MRPAIVFLFLVRNAHGVDWKGQHASDGAEPYLTQVAEARQHPLSSAPRAKLMRQEVLPAPQPSIGASLEANVLAQLSSTKPARGGLRRSVIEPDGELALEDEQYENEVGEDDVTGIRRMEVTPSASLLGQRYWFGRRRRTAKKSKEEAESYYVTSMAAQLECPAASKEFTEEECQIAAKNLLHDENHAEVMMKIKSSHYPKGCSIVAKPATHVVFNAEEGKASVDVRRLCNVHDVVSVDVPQQATDEQDSEEVSDLYGYAVGPVGTSSCPARSRQMTKGECDAVAKRLKRSFVAVKEHHSGQKGCYQDDSPEGKVHFDTQIFTEAKDCRPICMMSPPEEEKDAGGTDESNDDGDRQAEDPADQKVVVGAASNHQKATVDVVKTTITTTDISTTTAGSVANESNTSALVGPEKVAERQVSAKEKEKATEDGVPGLVVGLIIGLCLLGIIAGMAGFSMSQYNRTLKRPSQMLSQAFPRGSTNNAGGALLDGAQVSSQSGIADAGPDAATPSVSRGATTVLH